MITKDKNSDVELAEQLQESYKNVLEEVGKVIIGQTEIITGVLLSLLAKGYCLLV